MSGYGYGYGGYGKPPPPGQPYGSSPYAPPPQPTASAPYAAPSAPYVPGERPPKEGKHQQSQPYGSSPYAPPSPYGAPSAPYGAPSAPYAPYEKPPKEGKYQQPGVYAPTTAYPAPPPPQPYGSPFAGLMPSAFPPGTDPNIVACFQVADQDGSGLIDDKELQRALSSYDQSFSLRTVHLLMFSFTNTNVRKIGPKEFTSLFYSLQNWRSIFERFDRDRSGKIDTLELREALLSLGFAVSPAVLDLLVSKYDRSGGRNKAIEYDNFIECCLVVKGLTEKFKEKDTTYSGSATFTYEAFMLTVLPFLIAG